MGMQLHGAGEMATPFSTFTDQSKLSDILKTTTQAASPSTVTNIIVLPVNQNKKALKNYLREKLFAANHDIRCVLYKTLVKRIECNNSMFSDAMYDDFVSETFPTESNPLENIPLPAFINSDDFVTFCLNESGKETLRKILACFGFHFPHITYSPLIGIAAAIFLHYDENPSQVFAHVCRLAFSNSKYVHYLDATHLESSASAMVLKDLSIKYTSQSHKSLLSLTDNPDSVYTHWIKCLFQGLPFTYIVVLFDMYLLEGYKSLYRVSLAILKYYRKIGTSNPSDIVSAVFQFVENVEQRIPVNLLFKKAFRFRLPPSRDIKKLHRRIQSNLKRQPCSVVRENVHHRNPWDYMSKVRGLNCEIATETNLATMYCWIPESIALKKATLLYSTNLHGYSLATMLSKVEENEHTVLLVKTVNHDVFGAFLTSPWEERKNGGYFGTGETLIFSLAPKTKVYRWVGNHDKSKYKNTQENKSGSSPLPPVRPPPGRDNGVTLPPIHDACATSINPGIRPLNTESITLPPLVGSSIGNNTKVAQKSATEKHSEGTSTELFMMSDQSGIMIGGGGGHAIFLDNELLNGQTNHCTTFDNPPFVKNESFTISMVEVLGFEGE